MDESEVDPDCWLEHLHFLTIWQLGSRVSVLREPYLLCVALYDLAGEVT